MSEVLPNLSTNTTETAAKINLEQNGFTKIRVPNSPFAGISPIAGPFGFFDTRAYVSTTLSIGARFKRCAPRARACALRSFPYKNARELVVLTVGYNYLLSITAASRVETCRGAIKDRRSALQPGAPTDLTAGTSPQIDALRARVEMQTRQQQLIAARNDFEKQRLAFARTIGLPPGQQFELTAKIPYDKPEPISIDAAVQTSLFHASRFSGRAIASPRRGTFPARRARRIFAHAFVSTRIMARAARRRRI